MQEKVHLSQLWSSKTVIQFLTHFIVTNEKVYLNVMPTKNILMWR